MRKVEAEFDNCYLPNESQFPRRAERNQLACMITDDDKSGFHHGCHTVGDSSEKQKVRHEISARVSFNGCREPDGLIQRKPLYAFQGRFVITQQVIKGKEQVDCRFFLSRKEERTDKIQFDKFLRVVD